MAEVTGRGGRLSGLIPMVVIGVVVLLIARSCIDSLNPFGSSSPPADRDILGEDNDGDTGEDTPEPDSPEGVAMLSEREPECPDEAGEAERHLQWTEPPPRCIDFDAGYTATLETDRGDIVIELDTDNAPVTVNNFVFLARWGFYDGVDFHIVFPDDTLQAGRLEGEDEEIYDPGYTFEDEYLPEDDDPHYPLYSVAMGNTAEPDTNGSVFFIVSGTEAQREPIYSRFGQITDEESQTVVDAINATGLRRAGSDGTPREPTTIETVTITEN